jgi:hypothetical protein
MSSERNLSIALALAMLVAPFIALLYGREPALIVLAAALLATIAIGLSMRPGISPDRQRLLSLMLALNAFLFALALLGVILVSL